MPFVKVCAVPFPAAAAAASLTYAIPAAAAASPVWIMAISSKVALEAAEQREGGLIPR